MPPVVWFHALAAFGRGFLFVLLLVAFLIFFEMIWRIVSKSTKPVEVVLKCGRCGSCVTSNGCHCGLVRWEER